MSFKQKLISRIFSEANDLKRTPQALALDIGMDEQKMASIMQGNCELSDVYQVIQRMGECYPIDQTDMMLYESDCTNGIKIMRAKDSEKSARFFNRKDKEGNLTPYYEYRDTVMSRMAPFKPEWIKELRVVHDDNPSNPDVAYNNGHFMHQLTFFVGPVNFYWEVNGEKHCAKMNTGDSNYITPFWKHSFTARNADELCLILAITFGSEVRKAQKEIYALGDRVNQFVLDYRHNEKGLQQLILQQMQNENLTQEHIESCIGRLDPNIPVADLLNGKQSFTESSLSLFAQVLHLEPEALSLPKYRPEEEVVVTHSYQTDGYEYPSKEQPHYMVHTLARSSKMPHMKGFDLAIMNAQKAVADFNSNLHSYVFNYSEEVIELCYEDGGQTYFDKLAPGDSVYLLPFVKHGFSCSSNGGRLFVARASGSINLATQKELSYFSDVQRAISEQKCWFEGK